MKQKCIELLNKTAGRLLTKEELKSLEGDLISQHKDLFRQNPKLYNGMGEKARMELAYEMAVEKRNKQFANDFESKIGDKRKQLKFEKAFTENAEPGKMLDSLEDFTVHRSGKLGVSIESLVEAEITKTTASIRTNIKDYNDMHSAYLQDASKQEAIVRQIWGENTGDPIAKDIAESFSKIGDDLFARSELAGSKLTRIDRYIPQPSDHMKVLAHGKETFVEDVINDLDMNEYRHVDGRFYEEAELKEFLGEVYDTISSEGRNRTVKTAGPRTGGIGSFTKERQLHFRDADAQLNYMKKYGRDGSPIENLVHSYQRLARNVVWAENIVKDPEVFIANMINKAVLEDTQFISRTATGVNWLKEPKKDVAVKALARKEANLKNKLDVMFYGQRPENSHWANKFATVRGIQSLSKLGKHIISSLEDFPMLSLGLKKNGFDSSEILTAIKKDKYHKDILLDAQLYAEGMSATLRKLQEDVHGNGTVTRLNEVLHKVSFVKAADKIMRESLVLPILNAIGRKTKKYRTLAEFKSAEGKGKHAGIFEDSQFTEDHWAVARLAELDTGPEGNYSIITNERIRDIDPANLASHIENKLVREGALESEKAFNLEREKRLKSILKKTEKYQKDSVGFNKARDTHQAFVEKRKGFIEVLEAGKKDNESQLKPIMDAYNANPKPKKGTKTYKEHRKAIAPLNDAIKDANTKIKNIEKETAKAEKAFLKDNKFGLKAESEHIALMEKEKGRDKALETQRKAFIEREAQRLIQETSSLIYGMLHKEQQTWTRGAMSPSLTDKQHLGLLDAKAGTLPGELLRFITQFKIVPFSMFKTFMFDVPRSAKRYSEMGIPLSAFEVRAKYITALMITNMIREQLTSLAKFEQPPNPFSTEAMLKVIAGMAPLGIDGIAGPSGRTDAGSIAKNLIGPTFATGADALSILKGLQQGDNVGKKTAKFISGNIPFGNLLYTFGAKKKIIEDNLAEFLK